MGTSVKTTKTMAAPTFIRRLRKARNISATSKRSGSACLWRLTWCWRRRKGRHRKGRHRNGRHPEEQAMRWYFRFPLRLRSLFQRDRAELDLAQDLHFHLQNQTNLYIPFAI